MKVVNGDRHSHMRPESARQITQRHQYYQRTNEATLLTYILPLIIKDCRSVKLLPKEAKEQSFGMAVDGDNIDVEDPEDGALYGSKAWFDDGVVAAVNKDFRKEHLPHRYEDDQLAAALKKDDSMLTPRPDRCFGLLPDLIPVPDDIILNPQITILLEPCPDMHHPFFVLEGKSNDGSIADAENQARRGGATLVHAARQLLSKIGEPQVTDNGPDDRTFVFSATMAPNVMDLWVHWAELRNGKAVFHMNCVKSVALRDDQQLGELRKTLHNIMSWGCDLKARRLEELHERLYTWQRKETARMVEEVNKRPNKNKRQRMSEKVVE